MGIIIAKYNSWPATASTNPTDGQIVISAFDPTPPHKWSEWNFMGVIWGFVERAPTR